MEPNDLFSIGSYIGERERLLSKHTLFDYEYGLKRFKTINIGQILSSDGYDDGSLPSYLIKFVAEQGIVLMIPNMVNGYAVGVQLRSFKDRVFVTFGSGRFIPYGIGDLEEGFTYRRPVIVTEGPLDCECLRLFYKNVIAMSTAGMSGSQREVLDNLTFRVILAYDNDAAGDKAFERDAKFLREKDIICDRLRHPEGVKDPGSIADFMYEGKIWELGNLKDYYRNAIKVLVPDGV